MPAPTRVTYVQSGRVCPRNHEPAAPWQLSHEPIPSDQAWARSASRRQSETASDKPCSERCARCCRAFIVLRQIERGRDSLRPCIRQSRIPARVNVASRPGDKLASFFAGTAVIVYTEERDMAEQALNSMEFYRNESCGKCVPCRLGAQKMVSLGTNLVEGQISPARWKNELAPMFSELGKAIEMASICGLGRSVPVPLRTAINYFGADVAKHLSATPRATATSTNGSKRWL